MPRIRKWASSDGSGDLDKINWDRFGQCFFWHAPNPSKIGDFKFPYADIISGGPHVVRRAVANALARIPTADIPAQDKEALRRAAQRQLERFRKAEKSAAESMEDLLARFDLERVPDLLAAHFFLHSIYTRFPDPEQVVAEHALVVAILAEQGIEHPAIVVRGWGKLDEEHERLVAQSESPEDSDAVAEEANVDAGYGR